MSPTLMLLWSVYIIGLLFCLTVCIEGIRDSKSCTPIDVVITVIVCLFSWLGFLFVIWDELTIKESFENYMLYHKLWEADDGKDSR
jgi:hypothetical protein